jgi:glycosyltransferase involved in cell wall biosynthesis
MKKKTDISLLMITKNAEKTLELSLNSVKNFVSEIIVVDGGSTDKTLEILKKFRAKVFHYQGQNWGHQCQIGLEKVTGDWVLVLDSDEVVSKKLKEEIVSLLHGSIVKEAGYEISFQSH